MSGKGALALACILLVFSNASTGSLKNFHGPPPGLAPSPGALLMYTTNMLEYQDYPITFNVSLPPWLTGALVRNGFGMFEHGERQATHGFDAFAKLYSWKFQGNATALFSAKYLQTNFFKDTMATNPPTIAPYMMFKMPNPPFNIIERAQALIHQVDNQNVNVFFFPDAGKKAKADNPSTNEWEYGDFAAVSDFWPAYTVDISDLSTKEKSVPTLDRPGQKKHFGLGGWTDMKLFSSAHPLPEPGTKNTIEYVTTVHPGPMTTQTLSVVRSQGVGRRSVIAEWPVDKLYYMHSFSVTQSKVVIVAMPFWADFGCVTEKMSPLDCLRNDMNANTTLYLVDLKSGHVKVVPMEFVFTLHHINAYDDENGDVVFDVCTYPDDAVVDMLDMDVQRNVTARNAYNQQATVKRYTVQVATGKVIQNPIDVDGKKSLASGLDFPVINEKYRSRHYCYAWGVTARVDGRTNTEQAVTKKDFCKLGTGDKSYYVPGHYPNEPWLVQPPGATEEDDGLLLVPMLDGAAKKSYLQVLNATTLAPVSAAYLPTWLPLTPHGRYFPKEALNLKH